MKIKTAFFVIWFIVIVIAVLVGIKPDKAEDSAKPSRVKSDAPKVRRYLPRDTIIVCPKCDRPILRITRDIFSGDFVTASQFAAASDEIPPPIAGARIACPFDGKDLYSQLQKHALEINE